MPAPFRRACVSCVQSKRRCDLATPSCYRCRVRSLNCSYQNDLSPARLREQGNRQNYTPSLVTSESHIFEIEQAQQTATEGGIEGIEDRSLPSFPDYNLDWPEVMGDIEKFVVPDRMRIYNSPEDRLIAGEIYQARVIYAVSRMKLYPRLFVNDGATPFIHSKLYSEQIPLVIQDALSCCALYYNKNDHNQTLVFRTINQKAISLVAEPTKRWASPIEQLASVQALVLYQIIRLLDGDIRLRADAEKADSILRDWTYQLGSQMKPVNAALLDDITTALSNHDTTVRAWQSWIFAETLRRTAIVSFTLQGLYCFLKNGWDNTHYEFLRLSFYGQKALWLASSDYAWRSAMREHSPLPVNFSTWDVDTAGAMPSDMEDLGVMSMALMKGMDHCLHWLGPQNFEKFGLEQKIYSDQR